MLTGKIMVSMKEAIRKGKTFEQWFNSQSDIPKAQQTRARLEFEELENNLPFDINRIKKGSQYVVVDTKGWPPDRTKFIIHSNIPAASKYGCETLKYGNFLIKEWSRFITTRPYALLKYKFEFLEKRKRYQKPTK